MRTRFLVVLVLAASRLAAGAPRRRGPEAGQGQGRQQLLQPGSGPDPQGRDHQVQVGRGVPHNVTYQDGPGRSFASKTTSDAGVNFTHKFKKRGLYSLHCTIHPDQMKLSVRVR